MKSGLRGVVSLQAGELSEDPQRPEPGGGGWHSEVKKLCSLCKELVVREGCRITDDFNTIA